MEDRKVREWMVETDFSLEDWSGAHRGRAGL